MSAYPSRTWHDDAFFGIHYDLHAGQRDTLLGRDISADNLREMFELVGPDWVQCDCKGHPGWTCWPSDIGRASPGLCNDMLAPHREVCSELGIPLVMHFSGVIDVRQVAEHPEWAQVDAQGERSPKSTCRLSDYRSSHMIPHLLELIDKYDVDGFWLDGENWASRPCYCPRCTGAFAERTGIIDPPRDPDQRGWEQWLAFHRELFERHVAEYTEAVHEHKPACAVCSNWMYTTRQPQKPTVPVDYISGDYMALFGVYRAALEARLISQQGKSWDLMVWGFTKDYTFPETNSVMKNALHLKQEVSEVLAMGGGVLVYMKPQRTGHLVRWHHEVLAEVARFCRERQAWSFKTQSASDAAVLHLEDHYYAHAEPLYAMAEAIRPVEGALHALLENHISTDILPQHAVADRLSDYRLVVVPEQTRLSDEVLSALRSFAEGGGHVVMSGPHLADVHGKLLGVEPMPDAALEKRNGAWGRGFLPVGDEAVGIKGDCTIVRATDAQTVLPWLHDGDPQRDVSEHPAVTRRRVGAGSITAIHGPIFREYFLGHVPRLRRLLGELFGGLGVRWAVRAEADPRLEVVSRRKDDALLIHLINRGSGEMTYAHRTTMDVLPPIEDITLRIALDRPPSSVTLEPGGAPLRFTYNKRRKQATVKVPRLDIHAVVRVV